MAVSQISSNTAEATTMSMPTHASGDLIVMFAFRDGVATAPSLPAGWTNIGTQTDVTNCASRLAYKVAASSSETSGTWTNATGIVCIVYRGAEVGNSVAGGTSSGTLVNFPALTFAVGTGSSWAAGFLGHRADNGSPQTAPSGMTNRTSLVGTTAQYSGHDTNGGVTGWSSTNAEIGGSSGAHNTWVLEIKASASNATPAPSTISCAATVGSPTIRIDQARAVDTIAVTATVGAPSISAGQTASPATIQAVASVGAPSVAIDETVAVATIQAVATVGTPTFTAPATATPATIEATATVGTPSITTDSTVSPATIACAATVGAPAVSTGSTVSPATIQATTSISEPVVRYDASGTGTISVSSTVTSSGTKATSGIGYVQVDHSTSSSGASQRFGSGPALSSAPETSSTGSHGGQGSGSTTASTSVTSTGLKNGQGTSTVSQTSTVTGTWTTARFGTVTINVTSTVTGEGEKPTVEGTGGISQSSSITSSGFRAGLGTGTTSTSSALAASGIHGGTGSVLISHTPATTASGSGGHAGDGTCTVTVTLPSQGQKNGLGSGDPLSATNHLESQGEVTFIWQGWGRIEI